MQVTNSYLRNVKVGRPEAAAEPGAPRRSGDAPGQQASAHAASAELASLLGLARQEAEVRHDRLEDVARRLAAGELLTSAAAAETAEALVKEES